MWCLSFSYWLVGVLYQFWIWIFLFNIWTANIFSHSEFALILSSGLFWLTEVFNFNEFKFNNVLFFITFCFLLRTSLPSSYIFFWKFYCFTYHLRIYNPGIDFAMGCSEGQDSFSVWLCSWHSGIHWNGPSLPAALQYFLRHESDWSSMCESTFWSLSRKTLVILVPKPHCINYYSLI